MSFTPSNIKLIIEYENTLLTPGAKMPNKYFSIKSTGYDSKSNITDILRYVIEVLLKWTPEEASLYLNDEIVKHYKLEPVLNNIDVPVGLGSQKYAYILSKLYPASCHFNLKKSYIEIYKNILSNAKTPKHFFTGKDAKERACICLQYYIQHYMIITSIPDLYKTFGDKNIYSKLKECKLHKCLSLYNNPVEFLNDSLSIDQRDEFLFRYYNFCDIYNEELKDFYKKYPCK